jgi:hypothetical protein
MSTGKTQFSDLANIQVAFTRLCLHLQSCSAVRRHVHSSSRDLHGDVCPDVAKVTLPHAAAALDMVRRPML